MSQTTFIVKNGLGNQKSALLTIPAPQNGKIPLKEILVQLCQRRGIGNNASLTQKWFLTLNGKRLEQSSDIQTSQPLITLDLVFEENGGLLGGKGGYGSLLRNAAKTKIKLNDQSSNRTLNGRRIRDTENEKRLMEWLRREKKQRELIKKLNDEAKNASKAKEYRQN